LSHQSGSRAIAARERGDAQLFGQSRTLRVKQLLGLNCSMANLDLAAPSAAILPNYDFHVLSRAFRPSWNQLRKSSRTPSHNFFNALN